MDQNATERAGLASDAERDQVAAMLSTHLAAGRLTMGEFEDRVDAALAARTQEQLHQLTADLPEDAADAGLRTRRFDPCLLFVLLFVFPPAAFVYWLMTRGSLCSEDKPMAGIARSPARFAYPVLCTGGRVCL